MPLCATNRIGDVLRWTRGVAFHCMSGTEFAIHLNLLDYADKSHGSTYLARFLHRILKMDIDEYILKLISQALKELEDPEIALSTTIRKVIRIATLRNDYTNMWWLEWEMWDLTKEQDKLRVIKTIIRHFPKNQLTHLWKEYLERWMNERAIILHLRV